MHTIPPAGGADHPEHPNEPFIADFSEGFEVGLYLALLELIDEGVLITSDETILEVNSACCRLLEREYRALVQQPLSLLFGTEQAFLDARQRLLIQGEMRGALRIALPGGRLRDVRYIAAARIRPGLHAIILRPDELMPAGSSVQQPQQAAPTPTLLPRQDFWPQLAAAIAQPLLVADHNDRLTAANAPALALLGKTRETALGKPLTDFFTGDWPRTATATALTIQHQGHPHTIRQLPAPHTGGRIWLFALPPAQPTAAPAATTAVHPTLSAEQYQAVQHAIADDQLRVFFQPLVNAHNRTIIAGEALLRWHHPQHGLLPYTHVHELLHDEDAIARMSDWIMAAACHHAAAWHTDQGPVQAPRILTVNISPAQALRPDFPERVAHALRESGLPPERLELDLDEQILQTAPAQLDPLLAQLTALRVRLAIDDFGHRAFSLATLQRHCFTALKFDPALVAQIGIEDASEAILEAFAAMARTLKLQLWARGVTTAAQQAFLNAIDCPLQQGPLYGPPLPAQAFALLTIAPETSN